MRVANQAMQSIWYDAAADSVQIIDQTVLPHELVVLTLGSLDDACTAIASMQVRGAPLIGVTAAYGVYLALRNAPADLDSALSRLAATRPTAVNLQWALARCQQLLHTLPTEKRATAALQLAQSLEQEDIATCEAIGEHGAQLLRQLWQARQDKQATQEPLHVLTHCNAGALATVDWGTALAVIYKAAADIPLHVWVDETRPRNQGASLTCWELGQHGIDHTLIVDNAGGHLMQQQRVDVCIVGSDRTTRNGDVCNKIGTYLKALAAHANAIPFYVALPVSSIDFTLARGADIPIEERAAEEITHMHGRDDDGNVRRVRVTGADTVVCNPGFDVTPAHLVTGLITERGVIAANEAAISALRS